MKILIAYSTTEGQTEKIVNTVAEQISKLDHEVELFDVSALQGDLNPDSFDQIIVAGSVHDKRHNEAVDIFILTHLRELQTKPTIFISVSLAAAFEDGQADAQNYVDNLIEKTGWQPKQTLSIAGAIRHGEYGYYKEQILKYFVLRNRNLENQDRDHEFTDWDLLNQAIADFIGIESKKPDV
jgi:menaquinone-dependent protoporphyrinogen oxidase